MLYVCSCSKFHPTNMRKKLEMMSGSLGIHEATSSSSSWRRLQRSNSLLLASELPADSEYAQVGAYQRLSRSLRIRDDSGGFFSKPSHLRKRGANYWTDKLGKLFSLTGIRGGRRLSEAAAKNPPEVEAVRVAQAGNKKKRSSWLPDPDRRWPVQGW